MNALTQYERAVRGKGRGDGEPERTRRADDGGRSLHIRRAEVDVARARGLELGLAGLGIADTPRHASVLPIAGPLPPGSLEAASVVWAQMPRPQAILALGAGEIALLPRPVPRNHRESADRVTRAVAARLR